MYEDLCEAYNRRRRMKVPSQKKRVAWFSKGSPLLGGFVITSYHGIGYMNNLHKPYVGNGSTVIQMKRGVYLGVG
jgi:hypothetical protein